MRWTAHESRCERRPIVHRGRPAAFSPPPPLPLPWLRIGRLMARHGKAIPALPAQSALLPANIAPQKKLFEKRNLFAWPHGRMAGLAARLISSAMPCILQCVCTYTLETAACAVRGNGGGNDDTYTARRAERKCVVTLHTAADKRTNGVRVRLVRQVYGGADHKPGDTAVLGSTHVYIYTHGEQVHAIYVCSRGRTRGTVPTALSERPQIHDHRRPDRTPDICTVFGTTYSKRSQAR
jgi:hypothetical protein